MSNQKKIVIGTRGSELALWQANFIKSALEAKGFEIELHIIKTQGDEVTHLSLEKLEGKGFFTKEIEQALLDKTIDLAVHSFKDLPTQNPPGLIIAAIPEREDASELLIMRPNKVNVKNPLSLKDGAVLGTSSNRRKAQLLATRPDIKLKDLRGNLPTRIQKLEKGNYDAIVLAKAGVKRLNIDLSKFKVLTLSPKDFVAAPAQGALALQIREEDTDLKRSLEFLHHKDSAEAIEVERTVLNRFGGGCHLPLGCYCVKENDVFKVWTSKTNDFKTSPDRVFHSSKQVKELPSMVLKSYDNIEGNHIPKSIFISRKLTSDSYLSKVCVKHQIKIEDRSLIKVYPIIHNLDSYIVNKADWIFFNSKNALDIFFALKVEIKKGMKFATVGKGSAAALRKYGHQADFIGDNVDTQQIGKELGEIFGNQTVLFPRAKDSLKMVQDNLPSTVCVIDLPLYETVMQTKVSASGADILIFTSPSNAEAYFNANLLEFHQKVIAIGKSTAQRLESLKIDKYHLPASPDEVGIAEVLLSLS